MFRVILIGVYLVFRVRIVVMVLVLASRGKVIGIIVLVFFFRWLFWNNVMFSIILMFSKKMIIEFVMVKDFMFMLNRFSKGWLVNRNNSISIIVIMDVLVDLIFMFCFFILIIRGMELIILIIENRIRDIEMRFFGLIMLDVVFMVF